MAFTSYSDLKTKVASYLARSDLTDQIPDFISLAELRLNRELRIRQMLKVATTTTTDALIGLPVDFLEMRDIHLVTNPIASLDYKTPNAFYKDTNVNQVGKPKVYTVLATEFQLGPYPDTEYTLQMLYYAKPTVLSDTNPSNIWMSNCPDALLYGALGEAEPYLMNDARLATWAAMYNRAIDTINVADHSSEHSGQPISMYYNVR